MNELIVKPTDTAIVNCIIELRGQKVILDKDIADLYGVKAKRLREQVRRNHLRFPANFMFQLNENEVDQMVSHFAIPSKSYFGGTLPYAFTEHGILMLANVIRSDRAIQISIRIIELFVQMREMFLLSSDVRSELDIIKRRVDVQDVNIKKVFDYLDAFLRKNQVPREQIGYKTD